MKEIHQRRHTVGIYLSISSPKAAETKNTVRKTFTHGKTQKSCVWWYTPVISGLRRLRQEDHEFLASMK
jgi:hypothetical protein